VEIKYGRCFDYVKIVTTTDVL